MRRGCAIVALACISCGKTTALPHSGFDVRPEVTAIAPASDAVVSDAPQPPTADVRADDAAADARADDAAADARADDAAADARADDAAADASCSPLSFRALSEPSLNICPPSEEAAACAGGDVGVVVARSADCVRSWGNIPSQCVLAPIPEADNEIVLIQIEDCLAGVSIESVVACADRIELAYVVHLYCEACDDAPASTWRAFSLPRDNRPVIARGRTDIPPCRSPTF